MSDFVSLIHLFSSRCGVSVGLKEKQYLAKCFAITTILISLSKEEQLQMTHLHSHIQLLQIMSREVEGCSACLKTAKVCLHCSWGAEKVL